jgi:E3 ubiquitin-protein ligase CCNP1IP1
MQVDHDTLRRKNEELSQAFREKSRKQLQTQELYDKLKRRAMLGQVQTAASYAVDDTIQASTNASRFVDRVGAQSQRPAPPPLFTNTQSGLQPLETGSDGGINMRSPQMDSSGNCDGTWAGFSRQGSSHRTTTHDNIPSCHPQTDQKT